MKASEYRNMESAAIEAEISKNRKDLMNLRCQVALGEEVHPHQIRNLKKDIARMSTVLAEKNNAEAAAAVEGGK
ncbi:MAG: 50S ribosomal protein L29 [Planctomycetes bacterium]|nr:50S ribosomal protein L29 [Planctomycetota bacterium]